MKGYSMEVLSGSFKQIFSQILSDCQQDWDWLNED
jgi:hypothetical protein